jgi:signal transduction histidine kinase
LVFETWMGRVFNFNPDNGNPSIIGLKRPINTNMAAPIKPSNKRRSRAVISDLERTIANLAIKRTNKFLDSLERRLSKVDTTDKEALEATIKSEIQKNHELQKIINAGQKRAILDGADRIKLEEAIEILKDSEIALSNTVKSGAEKFRILELDMAVETKAGVASRAKLRQKDEEIEKLNREILTVAKISSHDLQEPLKNIQVFASLLLEKEQDKLSPQGKDYFARMQKSASRIRKLMQDLSEYTHLNKSFYKVEKADLNKLLDDAREELKEPIAEAHADITADKLPRLQIVPFHFKKIFKELLSNSLAFKRKDVRLCITIKCREIAGADLENLLPNPNGDYYEITFSDNGIGFDPIYSERIFDVFQKLEGNESSASGIGLATCKKIIENYDGQIIAHGEPGKGSSFKIYVAR